MPTGMFSPGLKRSLERESGFALRGKDKFAGEADTNLNTHLDKHAKNR